MARFPDLESLVHQHIRQEFFGTVAVSNRFQLEEPALPRTSAWILKVVQAAVVGRSTALEIQQTATDTRCSYFPEGHWCIERLAEIFDSGWQTGPGSPGQAHLLVALSSLVWHCHHPFLLALPQAEQALFWTGQVMCRVTCKQESSMQLNVSHRRVHPGYLSSPTSSSLVARHNAQVLAELTTYAYTCPLALTVDRRRLDALQGCRSHGYSSTNVPIRLGWVQAAAPPLPVPPATFQGFTPEERLEAQLAPLLQTDPQQTTISGSCLVSLHLCVHLLGEHKKWVPQPQACRFYWVRDGVIVADETLDFPPLAVSCALFASAQGLTMNSPLELGQDEARQQRRELIVQAFRPLIQDTKVSLSALIGDRSGKTNLVATVVLSGGALLTLASPLVGLIVVGTGGLLLAVAGAEEKQLQSELQKDLTQLQTGWPGRARLDLA